MLIVVNIWNYSVCKCVRTRSSVFMFTEGTQNNLNLYDNDTEKNFFLSFNGILTFMGYSMPKISF